MSRSVWIAIAVAAAFVVVSLWKINNYIAESERIGKLRAECSQRYSPECDELEER